MDDCPVFEVHLDGINVTEVVKLLDVTPDIPTLNASLSELIGKSYEIGTYTDSNTIMRYKKYNDGVIEYWGRVASPANGQGFATLNFPVPFMSADDYSIVATSQYASSSVIAFMTGVQRSSEKLAYIYAQTPTGRVTGAWIHFEARGFWK